MKIKFIIIAIVAFLYAGCGNQNKQSSHSETEHQHNHEDEPQGNSEGTESEHENNLEDEVSHDGHDHSEVKLQITCYSDQFELFAEADPFVVGSSSNILAHFTNIPDFSPLIEGTIILRILIDGKEVSQTLEAPTRKGIYSFNIVPASTGKGAIIFDIQTNSGIHQLTVPEIEVFDDEHNAIHEAEEAEIHTDGAVTFTKEMSWKLEFATELPKLEPFGQIIKTTAEVKSVSAEEVVVSAKTNGILYFSNNNIVEGSLVNIGQKLFSISGNGLADNNSEIRYARAKNDYETEKINYDRIKKLAAEKIISEKELINAKSAYDNAKIVFDNLNENFNKQGQVIQSPINGFIKELWLQNGQYVEVGQAIASVSQDNKLLLHADVQQKYTPILPSIKSATIRNLYSAKAYELEELNGKVLSVGKSTNPDNFLLPVHLQIRNNGEFISGSFVEVFLKCISNSDAITIPNTSLLEEQGNFFVYVQLTPELFEKREVKTGATDGIKTEIIKGLSSHERIVSKGAVLIKLSQATGALDAHSGHVH